MLDICVDLLKISYHKRKLFLTVTETEYHILVKLCSLPAPDLGINNEYTCFLPMQKCAIWHVQIHQNL